MIMDRKTVILEDVAIGYDEGRKVVASHLSGSIMSGELTCLLGANGVGKSTLLKTLSAFMPRIGGSIRLMGRDIEEYTDKELARLIGVVLTTKPHVQNMRVEDIVGLGRSPYTGFWGRITKEDENIVGQVIEMVGMTAFRGRMVDTLSDGERQKVMIAKALAQQTPIIYLDEPTAFLDFPSKVDTLRLLKTLTREMRKTIFLSTHDISLALQVADTLWLMETGSTAIGSPRELADNGALSRFIEREHISFDKETLTISIL